MHVCRSCLCMCVFRTRVYIITECKFQFPRGNLPKGINKVVKIKIKKVIFFLKTSPLWLCAFSWVGWAKGMMEVACIQWATYPEARNFFAVCARWAILLDWIGVILGSSIQIIHSWLTAYTLLAHVHNALHYWLQPSATICILNQSGLPLRQQNRTEQKSVCASIYLYDSVGAGQFSSFVPETMPELRLQAVRMLCMFGSTYLYEQLFCAMKNNKTFHGTRLTNRHLHSILRVSTAQSLTPNINELAAKKISQVSSSSK